MQAGDRVHDRYILESRLGSGGMAEVWCAHDERLERDVAVKFLSDSSDDPGNLVRFFSEAQQIARIGHPNVVTVLDFGDSDGRPFIVLENLHGGSIADLTGEPMEPSKALSHVRAAAAGAGAAHDLGIVHRDIKPHNLLLDEDGEIRLADFGIAAHEDGERLTQTGQAIGSPHYLSPEQAQGEKATPATDVYALGIVLYELITGVKPFDADNVTAIVIAQVERPPASPSTLVEDLDPEIEAVIMSCLAKDPNLRFEDGNALAAALEAVMAGDASPAPFGATAELATQHPDRPDRPSRGKRIVLLAAAAILVAGIAGAAIVISDPSPEGGDVAIAETPSRPTPTRSVRGNDGSSTPDETSPTPTPSASEDDGPVEEEKPDDEKEPKPKPSPTPTPTPTPTPSPTPTPISS